MKKFVIHVIAATVMSFAFFLIQANAQCAESLRADIPFDFTVGKKQLKAGSYVVEQANCSSSGPIIIFREPSGEFVASIGPAAYSIVSRPKTGKPAITFDSFEGTHFVSEIHGPAGRYAIRLRAGNSRMQLARKSRSGTSSVKLSPAN